MNLYSEGEVSKRVEAARRRFFGYSSGLILLAACAVGLIVADLGTWASFAGAALTLVSVILFVRVWKRSAPSVLFCKRLEGVNVGENEYIASARVPTGGRYRPAGMVYSPRVSRAPSNARPRGLKGAVYLRSGDGNVAEIRDLPIAHTDIYEQGDRLLRLAGTKYPIVISRDLKEQPCPICGQVNGTDRFSCIRCGLEMVKHCH